MLGHHKSIGLAEKRLFPLNYTPKRSQSLKTIDFVPVADFSSQEVIKLCTAHPYRPVYCKRAACTVRGEERAAATTMSVTFSYLYC